MTQGKYVELSVAQRTDVWRRWKAGESLHTIGRAFARPHTSIHCLLAHYGGIVPALRRRSLLALTQREREERTPPQRRNDPTVMRQKTVNGGMRPVQGAPNGMQRLSRFPAAPHVSPLRH